MLLRYSSIKIEGGTNASIPVRQHWTYLSRTEYVVQVLQESLILDLIVSEDESDTLSLQPCHTVQELEVIHQVGCIVGPASNTCSDVAITLQLSTLSVVSST